MRNKSIVNFIFVVYILIISSSCKNERKSFISIEDEFLKYIHLTESTIYDNIFIGDPSEFIIKDSILFVLEINQDKFIRCCNINTEKEIAFVLPKGVGPMETPYALRLQPYSCDSIQVFGKYPYTFFAFSIKDITQGVYNKISKFDVPDSIETKPNGILLPNQTALFHAVHKTDEIEKRYCIYNFRNNSFDFFGDYINEAFSEIPGEVNRFDKAFCFQPRLTYEHTKKLAVAVTANFLGIEVLDPFRKKINISKYYEMPRINSQNNNKYKISFSSPDQKAGLFSPSTTSNSIFCLYTGKLNGDKGYFYGKTILKFSWDLSAIERYELEFDTLLIQVSSDERYLYAICIVDGDYKLVKYEMNPK
jgi:hypothetical protein